MLPCGCWINSKTQSQFLGPLCLWQCFIVASAMMFLHIFCCLYHSTLEDLLTYFDEQDTVPGWIGSCGFKIWSLFCSCRMKTLCPVWPSIQDSSGIWKYGWQTWDTFFLLFSRSVLSSAPKLTVLNMEGNFGTFLTDDFFLDLLARNPLNKLATLDISFNDQGGVRITLYLIRA